MLSAYKQQQKMFDREALCLLDRGSGKVWSFVACLCTNSLQCSSRMFLVTLTTAEDCFNCCSSCESVGLLKCDLQKLDKIRAVK